MLTRTLLLTTALLALQATAAHATDDAAVAKSKLGSLPGLQLLDATGLEVIAASPGYTVRGLDRAFAATVFRGDTGWLGALELKRPGELALDELRGVGSVSVTTAIFVVAEADGALTSAQLPGSIRRDLAGFLVGGKLPVTRGVNLFVAGAPGTAGVLGQLGASLGIGSRAVRVRGVVGESTFARALGRVRGGATPTDPPRMSLAIELPELSPPALASDAARLVARSTTLTWTLDGGVETVAGTLDGVITIAGATAAVAGRIAVVGTDQDRTFALSGAAALSVKNLFGLAHVDLQRVAFTSAVTTAGGTTATAIGLELGLSVEGKAFTGALSTLAVGGAIQEVKVGLKGKLRLRALEKVTGEALTLVDPSIGYLPRTGEGFVGGGVTWKRERANAVLYARAGGVLAAFLELERIDLAKVVGATSLPLGKLDRVIAVLSTASTSEVPLADLPSPAREMLDRIGVATGGSIRPTAGLTVMAKLPLAALGKPLGVATDIVVAGSVGVERGKPVFALYGDLPSFALPPGLHGVKLPSAAAARLFLALRAGGELQLGVDVGLRFALEARRELEASGSIYVALGPTGGAVTVTGALRNDWVDPFGLAGITFKGAALSMSGASDGSVRVMMKGSAAFGGNTLALGGGVSLLLSTGVPTVKGFALRFGADELAPTTPLELSQVVIRAAAAAIDKRTLPKEVADGLAVAAKVDLVRTFGAALPTSRLARFDTSLALHDAILYVATPGMGTDPEFGELADAGVQVKGTLMLGTTALGAVDLYATVLRGFQLAGSVADVKLGQLEVSGAKLDIGAGIPGLQAAPPRFEISGTGELDGKNLASVDVAINEDEVRIAGSVAVFGARVDIQGAMTKPKTFELTGTATLDIPRAGRVTGVEVSFDADDGVRLEARVGYHGARFTVKGKYRSTSNWSLSGKLDVDTSKTIELPTGDVKVKIKGDAKLKLANDGDGATMSARMTGTAKATVAGAPVEVDLDEKINSHLKITFDFLLKKVTVKVL